eukprot:TRINITY_DN36975_c0_g1_i1.p1 TRINITY_DN36975_c0_g1~~TRINITY_DN36975_c0_g1_i1.p1  ORF type:complete len:130 (+),score=19.22 TRINITY_DN36975_c0_g1_i1:51-392(+)
MFRALRTGFHSRAVFARCFRAHSVAAGDDNFERMRMRVNDKFAEAMDEVNSARESVGTTYFSDDLDMAIEAVDECLTAYRELVATKDGASVRAEMDLKMEQLKADLEDVKDME